MLIRAKFITKRKTDAVWNPSKIRWAFYSITNTFQIIFDALSNFICYEGIFNDSYLNY